VSIFEKQCIQGHRAWQPHLQVTISDFLRAVLKLSIPKLLLQEPNSWSQPKPSIRHSSYWSLALFWAEPLLAQPAQLTASQYNNARTGANRNETALKPENVNSGSFGKLFSLKVDGDVYGQPLYLPKFSLQDRKKNMT
jgi:hypothetical protein